MNTKEHALTAIARLLEVTEAAIRLGDWKVDGACDPDAAIEYAKHVLVSGGYAQNSNDDKLDGPGMTPNSPMSTDCTARLDELRARIDECRHDLDRSERALRKEEALYAQQMEVCE